MQVTMQKGKVYGKCISKDFRITPDWKCVDFRINTKIYSTQEQQAEIFKRNRERDHYDVCPDCIHFEKV